MKFLKYIIISAVLILLKYDISSAQSSVITKHALIIAIGNYPTDSTGWPKISSANDIQLLKEALDFQGFEDITVIQDSACTKRGIIKAFNKFTENLENGDIAVVHFSCHGQQIEDDNGDEADRLDEAIVTYDAPSGTGRFAPPDYKGERHLRDDEFGKLALEMRKKLGNKGDLLVILDACHSGTSVRGTAKIRGGMPAYIYSGKKITSSAVKNEVFIYEEQNSPTLSNYVVISAARYYELNSEIPELGCGSLSFAVSKALKECQKDISYRKLFADIQSIMNTKVPGQTPTIEGDIEHKLFGGDIVVQQAYLPVYDVIDDRTIIINGGKISGIADSTKVAVFPNGTTDIKGKKPLATGMVVSSDNITSKVILNSDLRISNKATKWVFVTENSFDDLRVKVKIGEIKNTEIKAFLEKTLAANTILTLVTDSTADLLITMAKGKTPVLLDIINAKNGTLFQSNFKKEKTNEIILAYVQSKFIKELKFNNPDYRIEAELIPVKKGTFEPLDIKTFMNEGTLELDTNQQFIIRVKNTGKLACYYNIIDLQPNGVINAVVPSNDALYSKFGAEFFYLEAGRTKDLELITGAFSPYGTKIYKVIASAQPLDLRFLINNGGSAKRDNETLFETIFRQSYNNQENIKIRGAKPKAVPSDIGVSTINYPFIIKRK